MDEIRKATDRDEKLTAFEERLVSLRQDGEYKIIAIGEEIGAIKRNKALSKEKKAKLIASLEKSLAEAKEVRDRNRDELKTLSKEAVAHSNELYKTFEVEVVREEKAKIEEARRAYTEEVKRITSESEKDIQDIKAKVSDPAMQKEEIAIAKYEQKSHLNEAKNRRNDAVNASKAYMNQIYINHVQENRVLRGGKTDFKEDRTLKAKNYRATFSPQKFFLANGLYIAIGIFFIVCIILAPIKVNSNLFTIPNILTILEQSATRMFYALGVAGLILLAGTDLSIGRMVALGSVTTSLLLHRGTNIVTFFGMGPWNFDAIPMALRVIIALCLSIIFCVMFTTFAGFFTARLKIHPFITTLSTQLIIYGLLFFGTSGTPTGSIDSSIKDLLGGRWVLGYIGRDLITFPKLIIPAIAAIIVVWFIWNKTVFGKNMYAVGGNSEAAAVSGINVFRTTLLIFVMAGVLYGCGAFLEAFRANTSAGTGQGFELDAIAACVVGGISFSGGIGKISGAVIGVLIFQGMTYALTFLGIDTNLQFVFKGVILIAAVALDSVKYLKKK